MCKGLQQQGSNNNNYNNKSPKEDSCRTRSSSEDDVLSSSTARRSCLGCELCGAKATLYCQADDAYLCHKCDKWVHGANFLALRHIRCLLCNACQGFTQRYLVGASMEVVLPTLVMTSSEQQQCSSPTNDERKLQESSSSSSDSEPEEHASVKLPFLFL